MSFAANPRANQPDPSDAPQESTGAVASDSLAAESLKSGGGFSENENAHALGVKGAQSTLNTTDTSGASVLHPASSGAEREKQDDLGLGSDEKGTSGLKYPEAAGQPEFSGSHNADGYSGGPSGATQTSSSVAQDASGATGDSFASGGAGGATGGSESVKSSGYSGSGGAVEGDTTTTASTSSGGDSGPAGGAGVRPFVDNAPTYAATTAGNIRTEGELKPKGDNLTEGDIPQTKTFTGDVGGSHDPGRVAEQGFQKVTANVAGGGVSGGGETKTDAEKGQGTGMFDVLQSERA